MSTAPSKVVSFDKVEQVPVFPGCEGLKDELSSKKCFYNKMLWHIRKKFNTRMADTLGLESGKKITTLQFIIDSEGHITEITAKGPHKALEEEAIRVGNALPLMIPAKIEGKNVSVQFTIPISILIGKIKKKHKP